MADSYTVPDEAYNDEATWKEALIVSRTKDPTAYAELLRYAATVMTWSDDPERDLREAMGILDEAGKTNWSAWCRVDLVSYLDEGNERDQLLEEAFQAFTAENDRAGISSVMSARGEENPFVVDGTGLSEEEQMALYAEGYTIQWGSRADGKTRVELNEEKLIEPPDPTNVPALVITTGILCCMVCVGGFLRWGEAPIDSLFVASCVGCLLSLGVIIFGISMLWKVKRLPTLELENS